MSDPANSSETSDSTEADVPTAIKRLAAGEIEIQWFSGARLRYSAKLLRDACPCATCRERQRGSDESPSASRGTKSLGLPILSSAEAKPLTIDAVRPVGNYAYNITFGDGHQSGIYTLALLRQQGRPAE